MKNKFLILIFSILSFFYCNDVCSFNSKKGPLFLQVHFTNPISNITNAQLKDLLSGKINNFKGLGGKYKNIQIYVDKAVSKKVKEFFPDLDFSTVEFNFKKSIISNRSFLGISGLNGLKPYFKVLYIDNALPWGKLHKDYSLSTSREYALVMPGIEEWKSDSAFTVVQTGVTAMTRSFIRTVERQNNILYPIKYIKAITLKADLAVTSNEVSFVDHCRYPLKNKLLFCSPKKYFKILTESGFDIIELTGNHNNDFGHIYNKRSMDMMDRAGISYFGGGRDRAAAEKILYKKIKNVKTAYIGFNEIGPKTAWADRNRAGAARLSRSKLIKSLNEAGQEADMVFLSIQFCNENDPEVWDIQKRYFHKAADSGADIIVSSSAHRAMGVEFYKGKFISYGLGNFLFDQMQTINHRRGLIARHHFYNKRHIQTELIPYMIYNYAQPRLIYNKEAEDLMTRVFKYSLGPVFQ